MEIVDGSIQGWSEMDQTFEDLIDWTDMLDGKYNFQLLFDHNKAPSNEAYRIIKKYYWGRNGLDSVESQSA